jgi:intergrase/recombinase
MAPNFKRWLKKRYSRYYARNCYRYFERYLLPIINDKKKLIELKKLTPRVAQAVLESYSALRDYLSTLNLPIPIKREELKKYMNLQKKVKILEYESDENIIEHAIALLRSAQTSTDKLVCTIAFFTGMRGPEITFLLKNKDKLRFIEHEGISIVEMNYLRVKKNIYITMLPSELFKAIPSVRLGEKYFEHLREKGITISTFRKSFVAILSRIMAPHEIDLLMGRFQSVLVKHYTKHIREIAKKYKHAFTPYAPLMEKGLERRAEA